MHLIFMLFDSPNYSWHVYYISTFVGSICCITSLIYVIYFVQDMLYRPQWRSGRLSVSWCSELAVVMQRASVSWCSELAVVMKRSSVSWFRGRALVLQPASVSWCSQHHCRDAPRELWWCNEHRCRDAQSRDTASLIRNAVIKANSCYKSYPWCNIHIEYVLCVFCPAMFRTDCRFELTSVKDYIKNEGRAIVYSFHVSLKTEGWKIASIFIPLFTIHWNRYL